MDSHDAGPPPPSRTRMILYGLMLVVCGAIIGGGIMATVLWERLEHSVRDARRMPERMVDHMREDLGLTEEQARQVEAILARHRDEFEAIRREMEPRIKAHVDQVNAEIGEVLTPPQRRQWERRFAREQRRWARPPGEHPRPHHGGRMPPPPEPPCEGGD